MDDYLKIEKIGEGKIYLVLIVIYISYYYS